MGASHLGVIAADRVQVEAGFAKDIFRFLQLCCEGHNLQFQEYLRTQPSANSNSNLVAGSVDYLLRLQESLKDLLGYYASAEDLDALGATILAAGADLAMQVLRAITEFVQGPCLGNQECLTVSRLWDVVAGIFSFFSECQKVCAPVPVCARVAAALARSHAQPVRVFVLLFVVVLCFVFCVLFCVCVCVCVCW